MKKFIKIIFKISLFLVIFVVIQFALLFILAPTRILKKYGIKDTFENKVMWEQPNSLDVLFMGDSLVYSSYNPLIIWNKYGITSYDVASPSEPINVLYNDLVFALKEHSPKVIFIESDVLFRKQKNNKGDTLVLTELIKDYDPVVANHSNWKYASIKKTGIEINDFSKGYKFISKKIPVKNEKENKNKNKKYKIYNNNKEVFNKIIDLCKEHNIKLVVVSTISKKAFKKEKHDILVDYLKELNIDFIDMNLDDKLDIDWENETKDEGMHLNYKGAIKVSEYIGEYLNNLKIFEDKRKDSNYESWNDCYQVYLDQLRSVKE